MQTAVERSNQTSFTASLSHELYKIYNKLSQKMNKNNVKTKCKYER